MEWQTKPLQYGGTCDSCHRKIEKDHVGWHNYQLKKARCSECGPPDEGEATILAAKDVSILSDPIGGSSALRESRNHKDANFLKGATGEYLMDKYLHRELSSEAIIKNDRQLPDTQANIDHIVIAPSGVWIIDSKKWKGRIDYKSESLTKFTMCLSVNGKDCTWEVERIYNSVIPIAQLINDRSIPINPAVAFIDGDWSLAATMRLIANRPYKHLGVLITAPGALAKAINRPGPLDRKTIERIANLVDTKLTPR